MIKSIKENNYKLFYEILGYKFKDEKLLDEAFTHKGFDHSCHYERLEFLGDRIVNLIVAEMLFKHFKDEPEGALAKRHAALVRKDTLSKIALKFGMQNYIRLNKYDEAERTNPSLLCDICEAVCGAFYIDGGYDKVRAFIINNWQELIDEYKTPPVDAKTKLQEWAQARKLLPPVYEVIERDGAEHAPIFSVKAILTGVEPKIAKGSSKREAEQKAAELILESLEIK